jgi:hypothetical protein
MAETGDASPTTKGLPRGLKTIGFFAILAGVLGLFSYLSTLEAPPNLPSDDIHKLRFNNDVELIGLGVGELPTVDAEGKPLSLEKKAIETRVNTTCAACHGTPQMLIDGTSESHACHSTPGKCLPEHHPPKETCIKCHRMAR